MKNMVTPETALKLKNAGYPQPEPEAGQVWYYRDGMYRVVLSVGEGIAHYADVGLGLRPNISREKCATFRAGLEYAPDFFELANEIGGNIEFSQGLVRCSGHIEGITESRMAGEGGCELLAEIWLRKNAPQ